MRDCADSPSKRARLSTDEHLGAMANASHGFRFALGPAARALLINADASSVALILAELSQTLLLNPAEASNHVRPILLDLAARWMLRLDSVARENASDYDDLLMAMAGAYSLLLPTAPQLEE